LLAVAVALSCGRWRGCEKRCGRASCPLDADGGASALHPPGIVSTISFERKFDDSPRAVARYERNLEGFAQFLRDSGELPPEDDEDELA